MQNKDTFNSTEKKVCGIIICDPADPVSGKTALKYNHVDNTESKGVQKFVNFAKKFPTATHINFYSKSTFQYLGRIHLPKPQS